MSLQRFHIILLLFPVWAFYFCTPCYAQTLQFVGEVIELRVHDSFCDLKGTYTFRSHSPFREEVSIFYPLPNTARLPFPDSIHITTADSENGVPFLPGADGVSFMLKLNPGSESTHRIFYRQRTPAQSMEYILTTTMHWGRPLEQATFLIVLPDSLRLEHSSLRYDSVEKRPHETVFHIQRREFLPNNNLLVTWRRK